MNLYLAACFTNNLMPGMRHYEKMNEREQSICQSLPNVLESYHYVEKQQYVDHMRRCGAQVFLDSGAFSAYTLGTTIDIAAYCDYIWRNWDIIRLEDGMPMASVLDGIGDAEKTWQNQLEMERRGVPALPCFHFGEPESYLERYVAKYPYITIGGMVGRPTAHLLTWLDRIWNKYMVDGAGQPKLKVHAFGITSIPVMEAYPWYSVDSSSWVQAAAFGSVYLPDHGPIAVSEKSPSRHEEGRHLTTLSPEERGYVLNYLESRGFTYDRLSTVYESRFAFNLYAYGQLNKLINDEHGAKFRTHVQELF